MRRRARYRLVPAAVALAAAMVAMSAGSVAAHPLGNFTVNRAIAIRVGASVAVTALLDMAEIPAYEVIRELDTDDDDAVSATEGAAWAQATCAAWRDALAVSLDGAAAPLDDAGADAPQLTFPAGAGGLPTLRLECQFALLGVSGRDAHRLELRDTTNDERGGWREVTAAAAAGATLQASDVPAASPSELLTRYPEADLASPPDVSAASLVLRLGAVGSGSVMPADSPMTPTVRGTANDPLAALIGGPLSPGLVLLAIAMSIGLGAAHALSPGHGKTLVAAYVLGAGGSARSALHIGLWVAVAHTAGVFVLGSVTLIASQYLLPERLIDWLSLASGVTVTGLGVVLLLRLVHGAQRRNPDGGHDDHVHAHDHGHPHEHPHPHPHEHQPGRELTWRGAVALGFAGGAVPSASALIVLLVALATDRVALGVLLIACFGIGMALVLGGLALAVARVRSFASTRGRRSVPPLIGRLAGLGPVAAGLVVLATGLAFTAAAATRLT